MAYLYRWIPSGRWASSGASVSLPKGMGYRLYCP